MAIGLEERFGFFRIARKSARREHASLMRRVQRRRAIAVSFRENDTALGDYAVHVIDRAGNELLQQIKRLLIAKLVQPWPQFFLRMNLFHADPGSLRARLEQPGTRNARHEFAKAVVVEN